MKKTILTGLVLSVSLLFTGCGSIEDYYPEKDVLYLLDQDYNSVSGIEYDCADGSSGVTDNEGGLYFYSGIDCTLYLDLPIVDSTVDILHIEDSYGEVEGIEYSCKNGDFGSTNIAGIFNFDNVYEDDECTFIF